MRVNTQKVQLVTFAYEVLGVIAFVISLVGLAAGLILATYYIPWFGPLVMGR